MTETAIVAVTTFFATIGPLDVAVIFAAMTTGVSAESRRLMAFKGVGVATLILTAFALVGESMLDVLGISLAAIRVAGGILLLLIGIDMVFARPSGGSTTTAAERHEAETKSDISIFPLATPLIAGPGAMGAAMLLMADARADLVHRAVVLGGLYTVLSLTLFMLLLAAHVQRFVGVTAMNVVSRIFGILLAALAVQFVFDGVADFWGRT